MKNKRIVMGVISIITCITIIFVGYMLMLKNNYKNGVCNFDINGYETSGMKYDEISNYLQSNLKYTVDDLDMKSAIKYDFSEMIDNLKNISFKEYLNKDYSNIDFKPKCQIDVKILKSIIEEYNKSHRECENAYIEEVDKSYVIRDEVRGEQIDYKKFKKSLIAYLEANTYINNDLLLDDYRIEPIKTKSDMEEIIKEFDEYTQWYVEYDNGKKYSATPYDDVYIKNNKVKFNDEFIDKIVSEVYADYTKTGEKRKFKTHDGKKITVSGGTWGSEVYSTKEKEALIDAFHKGKNLKNRKPEYIYDYDDIGNSYIEVSIEKQHCWVYINGKLKMETDVVTGTKGLHDTPTGIYYILERKDGKYLTGDNYRTWVNKWMRLTWRGVGLHDAYWRGSFGSNIYQRSGSHGCINLPKQFAYSLYDITYIGMPVVIY